MTLKNIENYSQLHPLKEMWIGGAYPEKFYDHLSSKHQDIFSLISEKTNKDFDKLEKKLNDLGVTTHRPSFSTVDDYLSEDGNNLLKPPVTPCDFALTINDHLYVIPQYPSGVEPYENALKQYNPKNYTILDRSKPDPLCYLIFSSFVKIGKDIYIDYNNLDNDYQKYNKIVVNELAKKHRVHISYTGEHNDSVFCPIKNGYLVTTPYRNNYAFSFPGWEICHIKNTSNYETQRFNTEHKWHIPGIDYMFYNKEILDIAERWLGEPQETIFDSNMVVVDEKNVLVICENETVFKFFEEIGVTPHVINFETKHFWDAGLHCFTRDIIRSGTNEDYWPGRGDSGIYIIDEWNE